MKTSYVIWGAWFGIFLGLELPGAFWRRCPWRTLSTTAQDITQRTGGWAAVAYVGGLAVLAVHLVAPKVFQKRPK